MSVEKILIPDVLAHRYASQEMCYIWSAHGRVLIERELWIAVMKAQRDLGVDIAVDAIEAYERVKNQVDLESIDQKERISRHDVKARIDEFCELAGYEQIHKGMTSRDLTDNVEQLQILKSLHLVRKKYTAALNSLSQWAHRYQNLMMVGRTHNVPAQPTTLGKRLAMFGQEMLQAFLRLEELIDNYPMRGLQGAVGTQLDQWVLLNNNTDALKELGERVRHHLGFTKVFNAVGQVYPRSLDYEAVSSLYGLSSGISSLARTLRLMAGQELVTEGFQKGQVGSSAMPHKMNMRSCERINGFHSILNGYTNMLMGISGDQWNEGDVSCSVVRRVAIPGAMYTMDGQLETLLTVLNEMGFYESVIDQELSKYLPFVTTTTILMEAVRRGSGREEAHEAIKTNAIEVVRAMRSGESTINDLPQRLAADSRLPLNEDEIRAVLQDSKRFVASSAAQVNGFVKQVEDILNKYPEAKEYQPAPLI
ncbi:MAG: adenylosuccinate lyase [SAR324 cluster bacterium]|nr:adenylosuccinate lyase [SAR324 cluster bacterium]